MALNLKEALKSLFRMGRKPNSDEDEEGPISMVLLLREPRFLKLDQLRTAGETAFGVPFGENKDAPNFVMQTILVTLIRVGPHTLSSLNFTKPYGEDRQANFLASMKKPAQRQAWAAHTAWTAIDYVKGSPNPDLAYAVLANLCQALVDVNCVGIWMPHARMMIPAGEPLQQYLKRVGESVPLGIKAG
jgi:hypothetical protein